MKIYGQRFLGALSCAVELLREGTNAAIPRAEATYADLWGSNVLHEGIPGSGNGAYECVVLRGERFMEGGEIDIDVLDDGSAAALMDLFNALHAAEQELLATLHGGDRPTRLRSLDRVDGLSMRWANLSRPVPCTLESAAPLGERVHTERTASTVLRQEGDDATTLFWTLYELEADGTSQAKIDVIDWQDAQLVDMAREQLRTLGHFAVQVRRDLDAGREPRLRYQEADFAPADWPSFNETSVPEWLRRLAERGLDFDPGAPDLAEVFASLRDEHGSLRMGRRAANKLAWEIGYVARAGIFSLDDLREMAAPHMPTAATALPQPELMRASP